MYQVQELLSMGHVAFMKNKGTYYIQFVIGNNKRSTKMMKEGPNEGS